MTEPFDTLMAVQVHDTTLDQLRQRKRTLPEQAALADAETRLAMVTGEGSGIKSQVDELAGRQTVLEEQIAAAAKRRHEIEQRMLTGGVTASRDLQAMDTEVHHLAERQSELEELELALVEEEDPLDAALAINDEVANALGAEIIDLKARIDVALKEIDKSIEVEEQHRSEVVEGVPEDLLQRYEKLRSHLGGVGAARLVGGQCDGCHLMLPSKEIEHIRQLAPDELATCEQCGRILVH